MLGTLAALLGAACQPGQDTRASNITEPRVIALRSVPAEVTPGKPTELQALVLSPEGPVPEQTLDFAYCVARKPLAASGPVAEECLHGAPSKALVEVGSGNGLSSTTPADGCALFGPKPPAPEAGEPAMRPADPDTTGGYYQPFIAGADGSTSIGYVRMTCGLVAASQETFLAFTKGYHPNRNPELARLSLRVDGGEPRALSADSPVAVPAGGVVTLRASWAQCPTEDVCGDGVCSGEETTQGCAEDCADPVGCTGAEDYLLQNPETLKLERRRETIRVSWFVTGGEVEHDRVGREADDPTARVDNHWTLPTQPGTYWVAAVIRDDRGGQGWAVGNVRVQ